ncbi:hypothetical protein AX14_002594 [Amanita brunnescens Koide BX004]|nr:hypothetical protein AX14_002594 [Amanita brunnescens Koide BX004]
MDDRTSNTSNLTTRRNDFRTNLIERDGICVISDDIASNCDGCHIIPHAKGSDYISNVVRHRGGTDDSADDIDDINDIRNGFLISTLLHRPFGDGRFAFLKTPNFALTVDDIPYEPPKHADQESPATRLTLHHFVDLPQLGPVISMHARHNSDARQPQDTSEWPPAVILDLVYGAAALDAWSSKPFIKYVREHSRDAYHGDDDDQDDGNPKDGPSHFDAQMADQATGRSGSGRNPLRSRNKASNIPLKVRRFADVLDCVSTLWMRSSREDKPKPEDAHALSLARDEGVKMWLQSMEDPATNENLE